MRRQTRLECFKCEYVCNENERFVIMNLLTRWYPLQGIDEAQRRLSSLLDLSPSLFRRGNLTPGEENITVTEWAPLVDIAEDDKEYLIKAELPEVQKEDVKVTVENGTLTISGERKAEKEEKGRKFHRVERYYGRFERSFNIPDDADGNNVKAGYKDGILRVHVAKSEKALPKNIEVKVN
jgi:HSP20 family protein